MSRSSPRPETPRTFGSLIAAARKQSDLSREQLARLAGMSGSAIQKMETGDTRPQERTVRRLAAALGIPAEELLGAAGYVAEAALEREERVVGKVDMFMGRYEELGHTYRRIDERTETLDRRMEDFHASAERSVKAVNRRMLAFEKQVELLGARMTVIEKTLGELADLLRAQDGRSGR